MSEHLWEDTPLFGTPIPRTGPATWVLSKRDEEEAARPRFSRYRGPMVRCAEEPADPRMRCRPVTWLRSTGTEETPLCSQHKQEYLDRIALDTPRGSQ